MNNLINSTTASSSLPSQTSSPINSGDTAWVLISGALVMLLAPSLGFFYGGLVRQKNILSTIMQAYAIYAVCGIVWALLGFSLAFGPTSGHFIGDSTYFGMRNINDQPLDYAPTVPGMAFFFLQQGFCNITPPLAMGGPAERFSMITSCLFSAIWIIIVYCPLAHWIWADGGWARNMGAIDFAGGTAVHMSAGWAALILSLVIGKRKDDSVIKPPNASFTVLGAGLLWWGLFGFNGGSAGMGNYQASLAVNNTNIAASTAAIGWAIIDYLHDKHTSGSGIAIGSVCGLIAITPGSGYVVPWSSFIIGFVGGIISNYMTRLRIKTKYVDDALDVFACHGATGTWGVFALGLFADNSNLPSGRMGAFFGDGYTLAYEICIICTCIGWTCFWTFVIAYTMKHYGLLRISPEAEETGLDLWELEEQVYVVVPALEGDAKSMNMGSSSTAIANRIVHVLTPYGIHEKPGNSRQPSEIAMKEMKPEPIPQASPRPEASIQIAVKPI
jgi:Amt family ammonium transporter